MRHHLLSLILPLIATGSLLAVEPAAPLSTLARMPVREVTVFKDGHAFVVHEGTMNTDAAGNVVLDRLPTPVLGTFWPYVADKKVTLGSVTAAQQRVLVERTALTLRDLLEANPGADVFLTESNGTSYGATIVGVPTRSVEEQVATGGADTPHLLPQKGEVLLVKTVEGTKAVNFGNIKDVKFLGNYRTKLAGEEYRNLLTLRPQWGDAKPTEKLAVGMAYLQRGLRWIPSYRVELDGNGKAVLQMNATLINELTDLEDVTVNLVIGVPTFRFEGNLDPVALNQTLASLSPYFGQQSLSNRALGNNFSNAVMTQIAANPEAQGEAGPGINLGPDLPGGSRNEDLFVYTLKKVTLKKGQRLVVPVAKHELQYKDIFVLDVPLAPPVEVRRQLQNAQQAELARLFLSPKVEHKVRLTNNSKQPLTTAPALLLRGDRVLAQGMLTYTASGATVDLGITTAVDVKAKKTEKEIRRTPNALTHGDEQFWRVDLEGHLRLVNYRSTAVELEVTRYLLGHVGTAGAGGKAEMINVLEEDGFATPDSLPGWWSRFSWPHWWHSVNGVGKVTWNLTLEPGKSADLDYRWNYYWR